MEHAQQNTPSQSSQVDQRPRPRGEFDGRNPNQRERHRRHRGGCRGRPRHRETPSASSRRRTSLRGSERRSRAMSRPRSSRSPSRWDRSTGTSSVPTSKPPRWRTLATSCSLCSRCARSWEPCSATSTTRVLRQKAFVGGECRALYKYLQAIAGTSRGAGILEPLDRMTASMKKARRAKAAPAQVAAPPPDKAPA